MKSSHKLLYSNAGANLTGIFIIAITFFLLNWVKPSYANKPHGVFLPTKQKKLANNTHSSFNFDTRSKKLIGYVSVETSCASPTQKITTASYRYARTLAQQAGASNLTIIASGYNESMHSYILRARAYKEQE